MLTDKKAPTHLQQFAPFENRFTAASIILEVVDWLTKEQERPQAGSEPPPLRAAAGNVLSRIFNHSEKGKQVVPPDLGQK